MSPESTGSGQQAPVIPDDVVPDLITIELPIGARVLVVSELHLTAEATTASMLATSEVAQAIEAWTGPGVLIFNGDCVELLTPKSDDSRAALLAHPKLVSTVQRFAAGAGRRVVYLSGTHDGQAAWSVKVQHTLAAELRAELALAAELEINTGAGVRRIRVEPGHQHDPLSAFHDPRNPEDTPLAEHLVREILPALASAGGASWSAGLTSLDDPAAFPRFLASRLAYRRIARYSWALLLPVVLMVVLGLPIAHYLDAASDAASRAWRTTVVVLAALAVIVAVAALAISSFRRTWTSLAAVVLSGDRGGDDPNEAARTRARDLITAGYHGLVTGHTCRPELTQMGHGFYANSGCAAEIVSESPVRLGELGFPSLFLAHRQVDWVELEAGNELHVRLFHGRQDLPGITVLERVLARRLPETASSKELRPAVVAAFPHGKSWPTPPNRENQLRRVRRVAGLVVALSGLITLLSALSEPLRDRLNLVQKVVPLIVPEAAAAIVAPAGLLLLMLARGIRRGQHRAWIICEGLLVGTAILHVVKGVDVEESLLAIAVASFLFVKRSAFTARGDRTSTKRGLATLVAGGVAAVLAGTAAIEFDTWGPIGRLHHHPHLHRIALPRAFEASVERLVGVSSVHLPKRLSEFLTPAMASVMVVLLLAAAWLFFRPVIQRRARHGEADIGLPRAREVVQRHGSGTLDYFALRSDKQFFFWGDTLVAYGNYGGVCLVSPDPIGPPAEREEAWKAFRVFADEQGWTLGVLGAGEEWLPIYRAAGMHDLYVGDEAVVNVGRFTLDGGRNKGLRQAVNRVAKYGYTISFHDPSSLPDDLRLDLESVMTKSRRGDVERGFSMTLGRAFDPQDHGLLLAVVHEPASEQDGAGKAVAFCQYVPAPGINGYSLDLMRRDNGEHPNGLIDFAVVETVRHLKTLGNGGLGLNFAAMRAVLAGEAGEGLSQRIQAWLLKRMSDSMQIESLWKFNAKYDPDWQPRYVLYDAPEHALATAIAMARAESFWELPVIGRFLNPGGSGESSGPPGNHGGGQGAEPAEPGRKPLSVGADSPTT